MCIRDRDMFPGLSSSSSAARVAVIVPSRRTASRSAMRNGCASARIARASVTSWRPRRRLDSPGIPVSCGGLARSGRLAAPRAEDPYRQVASLFRGGRVQSRDIRAGAVGAPLPRPPATAQRHDLGLTLRRARGFDSRLLLMTRTVVTKLLVTRSLVKCLSPDHGSGPLPTETPTFCLIIS